MFFLKIFEGKILNLIRPILIFCNLSLDFSVKSSDFFCWKLYKSVIEKQKKTHKNVIKF